MTQTAVGVFTATTTANHLHIGGARLADFPDDTVGVGSTRRLHDTFLLSDGADVIVAVIKLISVGNANGVVVAVTCVLAGWDFW